MDETRIHPEQGLRVEPETLLTVHEQVAQEHVGRGAQPMHDLPSPVGVEGDRDRPLAPVGHVELVVVVGPGRIGVVTEPYGPGLASHRITGQRLDLDDVRSEIGQDPGRAWRRHPVVDLHDRHVIEWSVAHGHPLLVVASGCRATKAESNSPAGPVASTFW